jgi:protein required for attachment to host cells
MASIPGLYFVIARDDQARFVRPDPGDSLHTVGMVDGPTLQQNDAATTEPHDRAALKQMRFLPLLARRLGEDLDADVFTHLVLVAPPVVLQELTGLIDAATTASLLGSLARDLMTVPDLELWPHLLLWVQPSEVNCAPPVCSCR